MHVLRHLNRYAAEAEAAGVSTFHRMLAENPVPEEMRKAWDDS